MSTTHLAALIDITQSNPKHTKNESICETLTPQKVPLVERHETHQKVRRPFIMNSYLDLSHIETHSTCIITSLFSMHNETLNIYTHLIPGALLLVYLLSEWHKLGTFLWIDWHNMCVEPNWSDLYGLFVFDDLIYSSWHFRSFILHCVLLSLFIMCALSSYYHCGRCCDPSLHDYYLSIDWCGVFAVILCTFLAFIYVGFECFPIIQRTYFLCGCCVTFFVLIPMFFIWPKSTSFKFKAVTLCLFCLIGAVLVPFHWLYALATKDEYDIFLSVSIQFFILYGIGFGCFFFRLPERLAPGLFDLICNSHNIWHLCIVIAQWIAWRGLVQVAHNRTQC